MTRLSILAALLVSLTGTAASTQPAPDAGRAAGVTVMRAINTAQNAVRQQSGKYVLLADLLGHAAMGRVRNDIVIDGDRLTYQGRQLRLALAPDAMQYQAMVVPGEDCGTAIFSNEGGLIYTGKVLDCK